MATPQRWKDKLRPASWRGVRFLVDSHTYEGGRRGPDFEFPDREDPYAEDTGRRQRKYEIEGYLVGPDYWPAKNKLIQALEKKGPGDLVHPYYGRVRVIARTFSIQETAGAGGFVKLSMHFVEAGQLAFPKAGKDSSVLVDLAGKVLGQSAADAFQKAFDTAGQAQFVLDSATDKLIDIAGKMDSLSAGIVGAADPLAEFAFAVRNLKASAISLINSPVDLFNNISDAISLLWAAATPDQSYSFATSLFFYGFSDIPIPLLTKTRQQQDSNRQAMNQAVQTLAVINASNSATQMQFKSVEDATAVRNAITDKIDDLMETTSSDDVYVALQELRSQVVNAIPGSDQDLASIAEVTPLSTVPSLVLAHELYGSVDQEQDIIDRNKITHPGFIPGGSPLEVLDSG